ncbi:MAG: DUF2868 domain-containing protein, partial [Acidobacteriota bacterium]
LLVGLFLLVGLAAVGGAQGARWALGRPGGTPVNVAGFLGHALALQTLLLLGTLLLSWLLGRRRVPPGLGAGLLGASLRWATRGSDSPGLVGRLSRLLAPSWQPLAQVGSHLAWTAFNIGFLVSTVILLTGEDHAFAWQSTLLEDEREATRVLSVLLLPAALGPGLPDVTQVGASRHRPGETGFTQDGGLRRRWSRQLLAAVVGWGLAPRVLFLLVAWGSWIRRRRGLRPPSDDPYLIALDERLRPSLDVAPAMAPELGPDPLDARRLDEGRDLIPASWAVACWRDALPDVAPMTALGNVADDDWISLPRLDDRAGKEEALERLAAQPAPVGFLLICEHRQTPDLPLRLFLETARERVGSDLVVHVVVSGGERFRGSSRARTRGAIDQRWATWREALAQAGLPESRVLDLDLDLLGTPGRERLRAQLGLTSGHAIDDHVADRFEQGLARIEETAHAWKPPALGDSTEELERWQLSEAASLRGDLDALFAAELEPDSLPEAPAALRLGLGRALRLPDGLPSPALDRAAQELTKMSGLLGRLKKVDPRLMVAGLGLGLVAGPLGGALAAGSAGILAGASLSSTLGTLGAALGAGVGWWRSGDDEDDADVTDASEEGDVLGLPTRAGLLHLVVLSGQGEGETVIARRLDRIAEDLADPVPDATRVSALVTIVRREARP